MLYLERVRKRDELSLAFRFNHVKTKERKSSVETGSSRRSIKPKPNYFSTTINYNTQFKNKKCDTNTKLDEMQENGVN